MGYWFPVEKGASRKERLADLGIYSVVSGAIAGAVIAVCGYAPRPLVLAILPVGIGLGAVVGGALSFGVSLLLFGGKIGERAFQWVSVAAWVAGGASALVLRFATAGGGAWLAAIPAGVTAVAAAGWYRWKGGK